MANRFGKTIIEKVLEMKAEGITHREIAEQLGYQYKQIKKLIERYNKKQRENTKIPKRIGRPRSRPLTGQEDLEKRIKELEREVDLYRSFLQAAGRM
jgi:transposase